MARALAIWFAALTIGVGCSPQPRTMRLPPEPRPIGSGSSAASAPAPEPPRPWPCPTQGDVDGDGRADRAQLELGSAAIVTASQRLSLSLPAPAVERLCLADLDGDGRAEVIAQVVRPTKRDPTFQRRLFIYELSSRELRPRFLGTRGGGELLHVGLADLDQDGKVDVLVRERTREREQTRVYAWSGYQLTEQPLLAAKAPAYRFGPRMLPAPTFSGQVERVALPRPRALSFARRPAQPRAGAAPAARAGAVNRGKYYWLPGTARQQLARDGFVVVRPGRAPDEFHSLYIQNQYDGLPSFVTADTALHLTHLLLDDVLARLEQELLGPVLQRAVTGMREQGRRLQPRLPAELAAALDRVLYRLDVAAALLEGHTHGLGAERARRVEAELQSMARLGQGSGSLSRVDYRGFVVRGHYTRNPALGRYFQAALLLSTAAAEGAVESALLTALAVSDPKIRGLVALLDDFGRVFVGPAASRTPLDVAPLLLRAYGPSPSWHQLSSRTVRLPSPTQHPAAPHGAEVTLLARRWPADNDLLALEPDRPELPDPLLVFAALGSARAESHLAASLQARPTLRDRLGRASASVRAGSLGDRSSIGGRFLLSLRWVLLPYPEGYPDFQRTEAWSDHNLVTAAASWTEWRRDTVLYVQPPVVWLEGGDEDELPPGKAGFVEPVPELYGELAGVLDGLQELLWDVGFGHREGRRDPALATAIPKTAELMRFLATAARAELSPAGPSREQYERLSAIGPWLEAVLAGDGTLKLPPVPVVADVSYVKDPLDLLPDQVLTVGTGPVDVIVVAMPLGRRLVWARGAVSSFYAFSTTSPQTDEQWREQLASGRAPPQPAWARPVTAPSYRKLGSRQSSTAIGGRD